MSSEDYIKKQYHVVRIIDLEKQGAANFAKNSHPLNMVKLLMTNYCSLDAILNSQLIIDYREYKASIKTPKQ